MKCSICSHVRSKLDRLSRILLVVVWIAFFPPSAGALPEFPVETFDVGDGLPSAILYDLAFDPTGRLFILGRGGISVYDGQAFGTYGPEQGLPEGAMGALALDAQGRPWVSKLEHPALFFLRDGLWRPLPPPLPQPGNEQWVTALLVENEDSLLVGTAGKGLWLKEGRSWRLLNLEDGLPSLHIHSLAKWGDVVVVGTAEGLCRLVDQEIDCRPRDRDPRLAGPIFATRPTVEGQLLVLTDRDLLRISKTATDVLASGFSLSSVSSASFGAIGVDPAGGLYFGSSRELRYLAPEGLAESPAASDIMGATDGLAGNGVTAVVSDREGGVWVAGMRGLSRIGSRRFLSFRSGQGLLEDEVSAVIEVSPGHFILGHNRGWSRLKGGRAVSRAFDVSVPTADNAHRVLDLEIDGAGTVVGAVLSLGLLEMEAAGQPDFQRLSRRTFAVETDASGRLWVLTEGPLFVRSSSGFVELETVGQPREGHRRWLSAVADGRLFLATQQGLLWREGTGAETLDLEAPWRRARGPTREASNTYDALVSPSGEVLVATAAGLHRVEGEALVKVAGGWAVDRPVYMLLRDPRDRIWLGTDDGVVITEGDTLRQLTVRHGLAGREVNRGAGIVDHRGRVWIGTDQGLSVYQEAYDFPPERPPRIEIRDFEVNGTRRQPEEELRLEPHERTLTVHVDAIAFSKEEKVICRYRLDGFDDDWQGPDLLPATGLRYTNLAPGTYRFRIASSWGGGAWSEEAVSSPIVVVPPLWQRPWLYALLAFGVVGAALSVHWVRIQAMRQRAGELEELNEKLEVSIEELRRHEAERERLIDELESQNAELERFTYTVSHDLKSPLVTVRGFLGLLEKDAAAGDAERLRRDIEHIRAATSTMARLLDDLLELSRVGRQLNTVHPVSLAELAREAVQALDGLIASRGARIEIVEDLPEVIGDRVRLLEVYQNLIENAVRYMGDAPDPRVEIGVRRDGAETVFVVADNGRGIPPAYHQKIFGLFERLEAETEGTGVGLALVKRIVEFHGGRIWVESEGSGKGATFCFTLVQSESL